LGWTPKAKKVAGLCELAHKGILRNLSLSWVLVAHACNPSYSGVRDQEDHNLKPTSDKQFRRPYLKKKKSQKRAGGVAQGVGPEFKPQHHTHTKKI
jgi:hypothetical protein